jgi:hypothetical protein
MRSYRLSLTLSSVFVLLSGLAWPCLLSGQNVPLDDVPALVKTSFAKYYPNVTKVKWNREDQVFEAKYYEGSQRRDAEFDQMGLLLTRERVISESELPKEVLEAYRKDFPEHDLTEIEEITDARTGVITYELDITRGKRKFEAIYSPTGTLIRQYGDD